MRVQFRQSKYLVAQVMAATRTLSMVIEANATARAVQIQVSMPLRVVGWQGRLRRAGATRRGEELDECVRQVSRQPHVARNTIQDVTLQTSVQAGLQHHATLWTEHCYLPSCKRQAYTAVFFTEIPTSRTTRLTPSPDALPPLPPPYGPWHARLCFCPSRPRRNWSRSPVSGHRHRAPPDSASST